MTIQSDPARCWVRIDTTDWAGEIQYARWLIGDAWLLEGGVTPGMRNEFSLTMSHLDSEPGTRPVHTGMRLSKEQGTALRDALSAWLARTDLPDVVG
jgi:hypothetical protein